MFTASALARVFACPSSVVFPQTPYSTKFAIDGQDRHGELEDRAEFGDLPDAVRKLLEITGCLKFLPELKLVYDVSLDSARLVMEPGHRNYGRLGQFEIPMQADLIAIGPDRIVVIDYKNRKRVEPAFRNRQLAIIALAASRVFSIDDVTVAIAYPRFGEEDEYEIDRADKSAFDHEEFRTELRGLRQTIALAVADPAAYAHDGPHCEYCPAFLSGCPRQRDLMESANVDLPVKVEQAMPLTDDDEAAQMYELWKRIGLLHTRIGAALHARGAEREFKLLDGRIFGPVTVMGSEKLDGDIAFKVVEELHGRDVADAAVTRSATKKKLREALEFVAAKGKVAAAERAVLEAIRARGGSKKEQKIEVKEHAAELADGKAG